MNVLFLSIDSLRRDFLGAYCDRPHGFDYAVETPNLDAFAERAAIFDSHYAGSLPCMPARREWLTGTQEFLWRPWGPVEPFDRTLPAIARDDGVTTALLTDHYHYFQHGSGGYFEDFNGFEFVRGQEYDTWKTAPRDPDPDLAAQTIDPETDHPHSMQYTNRAQYLRNAASLGFEREEDWFAPKLFGATREWLADNREWERWFCYVDSFEVHEPFHVPEPYASLYTDDDPTDPELPVWPYYGRTDEGQSELTDRELDFVRSQFAGSVTMTDRWLGEVFDELDERDRWDETMVIVTADHGFFLGDHGWIGKRHPPTYDCVAHTPLMIWHPDHPTMSERIPALTSAVDLYATILDALGAETPDHVHSRSLTGLLRGETDTHRDWALYGYWGQGINVTDGRYTYHHPCDDGVPATCFSTTMMNPGSLVTSPTPKADAEAGCFLPYADTPVWRFDGPSYDDVGEPQLYDTRADPRQESNLIGRDHSAEGRMRELLVAALDELDAPAGQYERLGLES